MSRFALIATLALFVSVSASAQDLPEAAVRTCIRSAVRVTVDLPAGRGSSQGSGSLIDPRGYVLTNFHVVGRVSPEGGAPGTLFDVRNRVALATVQDARDPARPQFVGRVVRGDVRLDLALIRITAVAGDGGTVPEAFPFVERAPTASLLPGARLHAFGFPLGVQTINVSSGSLTGFQLNARREVAWLRTDAEFNPGNSGGMLVDARGRLVAVPTSVVTGGGTLEPIELARPVERIPTEWLEALQRGPIDDVRITALTPLEAGGVLNDVSVGDGSAPGVPERHFFVVPDARPGRLRVQPDLEVGLVDREGRVLRAGRGQLLLDRAMPQNLLAVLLFADTTTDAVPYEVSFEVDPGTDAGPRPQRYSAAWPTHVLTVEVERRADAVLACAPREATLTLRLTFDARGRLDRATVMESSANDVRACVQAALGDVVAAPSQSLILSLRVSEREERLARVAFDAVRRDVLACEPRLGRLVLGLTLGDDGHVVRVQSRTALGVDSQRCMANALRSVALPSLAGRTTWTNFERYELR